MTGAIDLSRGPLGATIALRGAEPLRLEHEEHGNLLWRGDPRWWDRTSPILFPVVGRCAGDRIRVGQDLFPMPLHGFAQSMDFEVVAARSDACILSLRHCDRTLASYPFAFDLRLAYSLDDTALVARATVQNPAATILPASFGFHPGFRWPLVDGVAKDGHSLVFNADRRLDIRRARDGLVLPRSKPVDLDRGRLALTEGLFAEGAMVLAERRSHIVRLTAAGIPFAIEVGSRNLPSLGIWMRPGADFLCIEPWAGHGDPDGFDGEIADKPGIVLIQPGDSAEFEMRLSVVPVQPTG